MPRTAHPGILQPLQGLAIAFVVIVTLAGVLATIASALGVIPWLVLPNAEGAFPLGMIVQLMVATLCLALLMTVPAMMRVFQLEKTHRDFQITMDDVARAYYVAHDADRADQFTMSAEFDAVRERMEFMRQHPDLGLLEPDIMEVAAQMSAVSRELASTYSHEKVERARAVLQQRQQEVYDLQQRIAQARKVAHEIQRWENAVAVDEGLAQEALDELRSELAKVMPEKAKTPAFRSKTKKAAPRSRAKPAPEAKPADDKVVAMSSRKSLDKGLNASTAAE
ncbi:MAG: DNA repair protein [Shimia sp.]